MRNCSDSIEYLFQTIFQNPIAVKLKFLDLTFLKIYTLKMKIALCNSPLYKSIGAERFYFVRAGSRWPHFEKFNPDGSICYMPYPFFLGYASSLLKQNGFDVMALDGAAGLLSEQLFLDKIVEFKPDVILLEVSSVSIEKDLRDAEYLKKNTAAKIVFAGLHSFMYSSDFLENQKNVDFVLIGEYEYIMLELCDSLDKKKELKNISGLIYRKSNNFKNSGSDKSESSEIINNGRKELLKNLDLLPLPDRTSFPPENYWDVPAGINTPSVQITASRGCPFGCIFCAWPQIIYGGKNFRQRSISNLISEIKYLIERFNIKSLYFDDDTFNVNKEFCFKFADALISENIKIEWAAMCRADLMTEDLLMRLKQSGLKSVKYGLESGSQEIINLMNKSLNLDSAKKIIRFTKRIGIKVHLTFCFGLPGETLETIDKTIDAALELNPDTYQFSIATPFPGSGYFEKLKKENRLISENFLSYDGYNRCVINHENLKPEQLEEAVKKAAKILRKKKLKSVAASILNSNKNIIFTGLTDYHKPYTRVRCYDFSKGLNELGLNTSVYSYQEKLFPQVSGEGMLNISERARITALMKSLIHLSADSSDYLYLQKIHYHAAAPYILAKLHLKKLILDYDDFDFDRSPMFKNPALNKIIFGSSDIWNITRNIAKAASLCVVSSNYLFDIFKNFNEKTFYIPTGVDTEKFKPCASKKKSDKTIYIWNGMAWGEVMFNNVVFLMDCFAETFKSLKNIEFRIAGDGVYMKNLEEYKSKNYSGLPIKFSGYIHPDKMPEFLNDSSVGLLPLIPDKHNQEWMQSKSPTKLFEYLAAGLPSVSHNFGEIKYIINHCENGMLADSKEDFVKQMIELSVNKDLYLKISENAVKTANTLYSQKKIITDLYKILLQNL
ncbi:MAG TPA: radical SAM protein [bacterium]|nr:radical SAM protein [bacterium]HPN29547.1 radical SAM protein [bacterium]